MDKASVVEMGTSKTQVDMSVTGTGCVSVSNRACYLCCLGHSYNKRQRIRSSGNTNLRLTSDPKDLLHVLLTCEAIWSNSFPFRLLFVIVGLIFCSY